MSICGAYILPSENPSCQILHSLRKFFRIDIIKHAMQLSRDNGRKNYAFYISRFMTEFEMQTRLVTQFQKLYPSAVQILISMEGEVPEMEFASGNSIVINGNQYSPTEILQQIDFALMAYADRKLEEESGNTKVPPIVGESPQLKETIRKAKRMAIQSQPVLITGDTGTGKDVFARFIHFSGTRNKGPFIPVNCTTIPHDLFESQFFGHRKGSFTGADKPNRGLFVEAQSGTIVLDEIGDLNLDMQVKLLRAIENQEIMPVGSSRPVKTDVRVLALTNRDLTVQMERGRFRHDLFYRLNRHHLHISPLSERPQDIVALFEHILDRSWYSLRHNWRNCVDEQVFDLLQTLVFPGNVRDIQNFAFHLLDMVTPSTPEIGLESASRIVEELGLQNRDAAQSNSSDLRTSLFNYERELITNALTHTGGNVARAAKQLGIARQNLQRRMRKLHLFREEQWLK